MKTKLNLLIVIMLFFQAVTMAQSWTSILPQGKPHDQLTFYDYQKAFNSYWEPFNVDNGTYVENGLKKKAVGWKQFKRWEYYMESEINPATGEFPKRSATEVYEEYLKTNSGIKSPRAANWTSLGPTSSAGGYAGVGRINCVAFHPSITSTFWVGTAAGGLWVTTDNGSTWTCLTDNNGVLAVSNIVIPSDFATSNTIYIATGDKDHWDNRSIGVLKSTDGGTTWNTTGLSFTLADGKMVNRMLIDPANNQTLLAATSNGVYKTTNGGTTWNTQLTSTNFIDMEYKPGDFNVLYGSTTNGTIFTSTNGGGSWTQAFSDANAFRIELAVSPSQPSRVYAIAANSGSGLYGIYQSSNSGTSFLQIFAGTTKNLLGWNADGGDSGGQGWYDLSMAASPANANTVLVGGVNTWRSTNGGMTWAIVNHWWGDGVPAVHADKHMLNYRSNGDLFETNDGGVYLSTDNGTSWTDKTNGMVISQMYKLGVSQTVLNENITGLQDNGTKLLSNGSWADVKGGDGMECLIDYTNVNIQYGTYVNGQIDRTTNHWVNATPIQPSGAGSGAWVTPYIIDPGNPQILYAGYADVWKTTNRGNSWTKISTMNASDKIRSMAIAPSNTQILFVASPNSIWKTINGGTSWTDITGTLPVSSGSITYIAVKNNDANTLWVTLGGYSTNNVFQSSDGGATWTNLSAGLPQVPAFTIVQNKQSAEVQLYAGTELGVYFKKGAANWIPYNTNLPNVKIGELEIYYAAAPANSKLRAATFGRGIWESNVFFLVPAIAVTVPNGGENWAAGSTQTIEWTDNIEENVKIELLKGGSFNSTIAASTPSTGSYSWTIPADQAAGTDYKVKITSVTSSIVSDMSDADFSIGSSPPLQPVLTLGTIADATPGPVVLPVHAANIVNMGTFQFTVVYDATKVAYTGVSNWYAGINSVIVSEVTPGHLTFVWVGDIGGIDIADGTFFNINFTYLTGSTPVTWSDDPVAREFTDWSGNIFVPVFVDGSVSGTGDIPVLSVTPSNQDVSYGPGTTSFAVSNIGTGTMTYSSEVTAGADWLTIAGGGSGGNTGIIEVSFTQNQTAFQRIGSITVTAPGAVGSPVQVTVTQAAEIPSGAVLTIGTISVSVPGPVVLPVHAANVVNMGSFQFTIEYDVTKLTYTGTSGWYPGITSVTVGQPSPGHLTFVWAGDAGGINIPDGTFFNINFTYLTGSSPVTWSDSPTQREFATRDGIIFVPTCFDGAVNSGGTSPVLSVTPANQDVSSSPGTTSFSVSNTGGGTMNYAAELTAGSDWLTITGGGSGGNTGTIELSFTENVTSIQRIGTVTVTAPGATGSPAFVTVTQGPAGPTLEVSPQNQDVPASPAGFTSFAVTTNSNWAATSDQAWCTVTPAGSGNGTIEATYAENTTTSQRVANISVLVSGLTPVVVTVTQAPAVPSGPVLTIGTLDGATPGAVVLPVHAANIVNMGSFQFTIEFNPAVMTYTGTSNWYAGITSVTVGEPAPGHLTFVWAGDTGGINIQDGTFFDINFSYIAGDSPVTWSDNPTSREFADWNGTIFIPAYINGAVLGAGVTPVLSVTPSVQYVPYLAGNTSFAVANVGGGTMTYAAEVTSGAEWLTITGGGSGGNDGTIRVSYTQNPDVLNRIGTITVTAPGATGSPVEVTVSQAPYPIMQPVLTIGTLTVSEPGTIVLPVTAADVINMGSFQFTLVYDPAVMTFVNTTNWYPGITAVTVGEPSPGHITFVWAGDAGGIYISNDIFFNLYFTYIAGSSTVSWSDNPTPREFASWDGNIIYPVYYNGAVNALVLPVLEVTPANQDVSYDQGTTSFTVTNTGGGTMNYIAGVVPGYEWLTITGGGTGGNSGTINVSYTQNPDGIQRDGIIMVTADGATGSPAYVTVTQAPMPPPGPALTIATIIVSTPGPIVLPVNASAIANMGSFQFTLVYDPAVMTFTGTSDWYPGITAVTVGEPSAGHLTFVWAGDTGGINIPDGTFFNLNFSYLAGSSTVTWSDNPTSREFADWDGNIFIPTYDNGAVNEGGTTPVLTVTPSNQDVSYLEGNTSFNIANTGGGTMTYTSEVTSGSDWLTITGGGTGGNSGTIDVSFLVNQGSPRIGTITITAPGATGSPVEVTVSQEANPYAVEDFILNNHIKVYPNPVNSTLKISSDNPLIKIQTIEISNNLSEVVYKSGTMDAPQIQINVSALPPAPYMLKIQTGKGLLMKKIIVIR